VIEAIRPIVKHGLWYRQETIEHELGACVETFYLHISGEEKSGGKCFIRASKQDAHGFGSALTYCRRYGLMAACGIAPEDDDANAASKTRPTPVPRNAGASASPAQNNAPAGDPAPSQEDIERAAGIIRACKTLVNLQVEWQGLPKAVQKEIVAVKDEVKAALVAAQKKPGEAAQEGGA